MVEVPVAVNSAAPQTPPNSVGPLQNVAHMPEQAVIEDNRADYSSLEEIVCVSPWSRAEPASIRLESIIHEPSSKRPMDKKGKGVQKTCIFVQFHLEVC